MGFIAKITIINQKMIKILTINKTLTKFTLGWHENWTDIHTSTERHTERHTERQIYRRTERQTDTISTF